MAAPSPMRLLLAGAIAGAVFAASVRADFTRMLIVPYDNPAMPAPPSGGPWDTWRVYLEFDAAGDQCIGVGGDAATPLMASTFSNFWQETTAGGDVEHLAALDASVAGLHFDTYWTIGSTDAGANPVTSAFWNDGPHWTGNSFVGDDGAYYRLPTDPLTVGVFDGFTWRVLIGQFTFQEGGGLSVSGQVNVTIGGSFQSIATGIDIAPTLGACCLDDSACVRMTPTMCGAAAGVYEGDGTSCAPNPCPQLGACCFVDGNCADWFQADCDTKGGTWQGPGTGCAPGACPPPPDPNGWVVTVVETRMTSHGFDSHDAAVDDGVITYTVDGFDKDVLGFDALGSSWSIDVGDGEQYLSDVSGDQVVYVDNRSGDDDVMWMFDFRTGEPNIIITSHGSQYSPAISGDYVVWGTNEDVSPDVYWMHRDGAETPLATEPWGEYTPAIDGNLAAWLTSIPGSNGDIHAAVLGQAPFAVTTGPEPEHRPSVSGNLIAYIVSDDVALYDHATGETTRITNDAYDQSAVVVTGRTILWTDDRNGNDNVFLYDLDKDVLFRLTDDPSDQVLTDADGNVAVFHDDRAGNLDVFKVEWTIEVNTLGACCFDDGACSAILLSDCLDQGGAHQGAGTSCAPNPCPSTCCYDDGSLCTVTTEFDCEANLAGTWGGWPSCTPNPCVGACCPIDGSCHVVTSDACDALPGAWEGPGTTCAPSPCPPALPRDWAIEVVETRLTSDSFDRYDAAVDEGVITYTVEGFNSLDVVGFDASGIPWSIGLGDGDQYRSDVSGDQVVYVDNRSGDDDVMWMFDFRTGEPNIIITSHGSQYSPAISGDYVVWGTNEDVSPDVYWMHRDGAETPLATEPWGEYTPAIDGNLAAWLTSIPGSNGDIHAAVLGQAPFAVTTGPEPEHRPSVSGNLIAYIVSDDVALYDHATGETTRITNDAYDQSAVVVTGRTILWTDDRNGNDNVFLYDLDKDVLFRLTDDPSDQVLTDADGTTAVFHDDRDGDLDVFRIDWTITPACPWDLDGDDVVGFDDLLRVLSAWGPCPPCPEDFDGDGIVGFGDLLEVLSRWGACA